MVSNTVDVESILVFVLINSFEIMDYYKYACGCD